MMYISEISSSIDTSSLKKFDEEYKFNKIFLDTGYSMEVRDVFDSLNESKDVGKIKGTIDDPKSQEIIEFFLKQASSKKPEFFPVGDNVNTMKRLLVRYGTNKNIKKSDRILFLIKENNKPIINFIENELKLSFTLL